MVGEPITVTIVLLASASARMMMWRGIWCCDALWAEPSSSKLMVASSADAPKNMLLTLRAALYVPARSSVEFTCTVIAEDDRDVSRVALRGEITTCASAGRDPRSSETANRCDPRSRLMRWTVAAVEAGLVVSR